MSYLSSPEETPSPSPELTEEEEREGSIKSFGSGYSSKKLDIVDTDASVHSSPVSPSSPPFDAVTPPPSHVNVEPLTPYSFPEVKIEEVRQPYSPSHGPDYNQFVRDVLLWTSKPRTAFYFISGWALIYLNCFLSAYDVTFFSGVCYLLLASLSLNFLRALVAPKLAESCSWADSGLTALVSSAAVVTINAAAAIHDVHLNGRDPLKTLEVAVLLWLLSLLGRHLSALTLLAVCHLGAFTVPVLYMHYKKTIDGVAADLYGKVKARYDVLDRRVKASGIFVVLLAVAMLLPACDKAAAGVVFLAYCSCILKPNELSNFQRHAAPLGNTVRTVGDTAIHLAVSAANKYELTPTPLKRRKED